VKLRTTGFESHNLCTMKSGVWYYSKEDSDWLPREDSVDRSGIPQTAQGSVVKANALGSVFSDMTSMIHVNEATILHNLEYRAYCDLPYTWLGGVLVSVNPLKQLKEPTDVGLSSVARETHPFAVAEKAFQGMRFAKSVTGSDAHQSIIISGESGSGKSESAKRIIRHLVTKSGAPKLENSLIAIIPVLENFGNATTVSNENSSRFGKLTKLFFDHSGVLVQGGIETYLLEKSRVTFHCKEERNFHIFYRLLAGISDAQLRAWGLEREPDSFLILGDNIGVTKSDATQFVKLQKSLAYLGIDDTISNRIFATCAGLLHLGNMIFVQDNDRLKIESVSHFQYAAALLKLPEEELENHLCHKKINVSGECIYTCLSPTQASYAREGMVRCIYASLFEWIVATANTKFAVKNKSENVSIGVLDIFGFECFAKNSLSQLLINFANEVLQRTFSKQVLISEAALFLSEGILVDVPVTHETANDASQLLFGGSSSILLAIENETRSTAPNDSKLIATLHRSFSSHSSYSKPHPRYEHSRFIVHHFAGPVTYEVEGFVEQNTNKAPLFLHELLLLSSDESLIKSLKPTFKRSRSSLVSSGICASFGTGIGRLVDHLESTQCSFIRCIKPNKSMHRGVSKGWFNRKFVTQQLRYLSIPETAQVLKSGGYPLRIDYEQVATSYSSFLPNEAISRWKAKYRQDNSLFTRALFSSIGVKSGIKFGITKLFFSDGSFEDVESQFQKCKLWTNDQKSECSERFFKFLSTRLWKRCLARAKSVLAFNALLCRVRMRGRAALIVTRFIRRTYILHSAAKRLQRWWIQYASRPLPIDNPIVETLQENLCVKIQPEIESESDCSTSVYSPNSWESEKDEELSRLRNEVLLLRNELKDVKKYLKYSGCDSSASSIIQNFWRTLGKKGSSPKVSRERAIEAELRSLRIAHEEQAKLLRQTVALVKQRSSIKKIDSEPRSCELLDVVSACSIM